MSQLMWQTQLQPMTKVKPCLAETHIQQQSLQTLDILYLRPSQFKWANKHSLRAMRAQGNILITKQQAKLKFMKMLSTAQFPSQEAQHQTPITQTSLVLTQLSVLTTYPSQLQSHIQSQLAYPSQFMQDQTLAMAKMTKSPSKQMAQASVQQKRIMELTM